MSAGGSTSDPGTPPSATRVVPVDLPDLGRRGGDPLVSVIVPTYGDADRLGPALRSVASQTYPSVEIVVVDGSDVDWLASLADRTEGVTYVAQEPRGLAAARNRGIEAATGEVVGFLDADDRWHPRKLERQVPALRDGADVVYSDAYVVADDAPPRRLSSLPVAEPDRHHVDFLHGGGVPVLTVLVRRDCLEDVRFDERLPAVEDRNLLARLFARYEPARVAEPLAYYTRRDDSMSSDAEAMYRAELANLDYLAAELPDVAAHRAALERLAEYKYAKRLLRTGDAVAARERLLAVVAGGHVDRRTLALLALSALPFGHRRGLRGLERLRELAR